MVDKKISKARSAVVVSRLGYCPCCLERPLFKVEPNYITQELGSWDAVLLVLESLEHLGYKGGGVVHDEYTWRQVRPRMGKKVCPNLETPPCLSSSVIEMLR